MFQNTALSEYSHYQLCRNFISCSHNPLWNQTKKRSEHVKRHAKVGRHLKLFLGTPQTFATFVTFTCTTFVVTHIITSLCSDKISSIFFHLVVLTFLWSTVCGRYDQIASSNISWSLKFLHYFFKKKVPAYIWVNKFLSPFFKQPRQGIKTLLSKISFFH